MIKLFAFDLDGTVLNSKSQIADESIKAFRKLDQNGVKFVFATGRVSTSVSYMMDKTGIDNPMVANNGAISFLNKDTILKETYLDLDQLKRLREFANDRNLYYHFYDLDTFYSQYLVENKLAHLRKSEPSTYNLQVDLSISKNPIDQLVKNKSHALKFQIYLDEESGISKKDLLFDLNKEFADELYVTSSGGRLVEIMHKGVSKWEALKEIGSTLGISSNEMAAIGDADNDLPMVKNAGLGFAMGNASDQVKEIADFIVDTNDNFGVVQAIEKVLEINKNV